MQAAILTVNLSALAKNYHILKNRHTAKHLAAVVKANAYGLGIEAVSTCLWNEGCRDFFVATLSEAIELRSILPEAKIGVFQGLFADEEREYQHHHLTPILNTVEQAERFTKMSWQTGGILHIDTGMTRLGLNESELKNLPALLPNICCVMSHLACANEPNHPKNMEQLTRFKTALKQYPNAKASLANSAGVFLPPEFHFDMARPGCALYGIHPTDSQNAQNLMLHVASLSAPLLQIRTLDRDESVGYGSTYNVKKGGKIAIAGMGYADGYFRLLGNQASAFINGYRTPLAGRVSMDMVALDVSHIPDEKLANSAHAEFINAEQTVNDIARTADTIGYEIFTRIGARVQRNYLP